VAKKTDNDILLQTRVPAHVAREIRRRAKIDSDTDAGWLRRLLTHETEQQAPGQSGEFFDLEHLYIRKTSVVAMKWVDPNAGTCAGGEKPWKLRVDLVDGTSWTLPTPSAKIILKAFGLPTENPHPKGSKP